ncbi:MAG: PilN domain-containing protein [Candidatus Omnitrophica bacterium]|nr:PilN domain-containing protein [Candidatus Omnitrophota bacterium]
MNPKQKKPIIAVQFSDQSITCTRFLPLLGSRRKFLGFAEERLPADANEKQTLESLRALLKKQEFNNNQVIICLPRSKATCRYIKIPSQNPSEIEKIISLQVSRYLPYTASELISGYQIINVDKEGYAHLNLTIVHKDVINRYLNLFKELKPERLSIILSSYGIISLCNHLDQKIQDPVMVINTDEFQVEIAIMAYNRLIFSRYFSVSGLRENLHDALVDEIKRTNDAYVREVKSEALQKLIVLSAKQNPPSFIELMGQQTHLSVKEVIYPQQIRDLDSFQTQIAASQTSYADLVGLAYLTLDESFNLLPQETKTKSRSHLAYKDRMRLASIVCAIILVFSLALAKHMNNKRDYLAFLRHELTKIEGEAKSLAEIEKRFELLKKRSQKIPSSLDVLSEVHAIIPSSVTLANLLFEDDREIIIRGNAPDHALVFSFVSAIEQSPVFKTFSAKLKFATKKTTQLGEVIDFEIVCAKEQS